MSRYAEYDNTVAYYDGIAEGYDELHYDEQITKFTVLRKNMALKKGSKVLDVGCGTFFSKSFFDWDMWGIEPSARMVALFSKDNPNEKERIKVGFAEDIADVYGENSFDAIMCVSAVHHFKNMDDVFQKMKKVCVPNGIISITILKNTGNFDTIQKKIHDVWKTAKALDSPKDLIFVCENIK